MTLDKWQRMTEWFMTALALVFLLAYSWEVLARTHILLCETVINIIWRAFIVDYVVSILLAEDKKTWFKDNLLMLVSIALPVFRPLRLLRLVAVLNVLNRTGGMAVRGRITLYTCCSVTLLMLTQQWADRRNGTCGGTLERINHDELLHDRLIDRSCVTISTRLAVSA